MQTLKDLTWENHKKAERTLFIKRLLKRQLTTYQYYTYLCNQLVAYSLLEHYALQEGVLTNIEKIVRTDKIAKDIFELEQQNPSFRVPGCYKSTNKYLERLNAIKNNSDALMAHIYVRHMGDLSGGQIIKKYVPGPSNHYEFDCDVNELKDLIRAKLSNNLADEANNCFVLIQDIFDEMETDFANMEQSN